MRSLKRHRQHVASTQAMVASALWLLSMMRQTGSAFVVVPSKKPFSMMQATITRRSRWRLFALPEIKDMPLRDMRAELESYGISTRSFLEKREFLDALHKAREEGMTPINGSNTNQANGATSTTTNTVNENTATNNAEAESKTATTTTTPANGTQQQQPKTSSNTAARQQRLEQELENANTLRVGELRQKLKDMGINTKSFFEKSEFVKAYAEAMVDGISAPAGAVQEEPFDPDYRDVVMQKFDPQAKPGFLLSGTIIDVDLLK